MGIHSYSMNIQMAMAALAKHRDGRLACAFLDHLQATGLSQGRVATYGNKLRSRVILIGVRGPNITPRKGDQLLFGTSVITKVDTHPNRRGPPGSPATQDEMTDPKGHGGLEVSVLTSDEPWNEYRLLNTDIRAHLKLMINGVYCIRDRYEANGDPLYIVNFATVPTIEH